MAIRLHLLVCGNCILRNEKGVCEVDGVTVDPVRLACFEIHSHFEDKGYALEAAPSVRTNTGRFEKE
jgi:hypothetical protein